MKFPINIVIILNPLMAKSLILHRDKQGVTQLEKMMWDERRSRLCFAWSVFNRKGGGDPVVLWAGKKYNCKGWTLTPPDLASKPLWALFDL